MSTWNAAEMEEAAKNNTTVRSTISGQHSDDHSAHRVCFFFRDKHRFLRST